MDWSEKSCHHQDSIPEPSRPYRVAIVWVPNPNPSSVLRAWSREGKVKNGVFVESYVVSLLGLFVPEHRGTQLFRNAGNSIDLMSQKIHSSSDYYENLKSLILNFTVAGVRCLVYYFLDRSPNTGSCAGLKESK